VALAERSTHLEKISKLEQYIIQLEQQITQLISERPKHLEKISFLEQEISELREHPVLFSSSHGITTVSPISLGPDSKNFGSCPPSEEYLTPEGSSPRMGIFRM
jgi:hypothetical protein